MIRTDSFFLKEAQKIFKSKKGFVFCSQQNCCMLLRNHNLKAKSSSQIMVSTVKYITNPYFIVGAVSCVIVFNCVLKSNEKQQNSFSFKYYCFFVGKIANFAIKRIAPIFGFVLVGVFIRTCIPSVYDKSAFLHHLPSTQASFASSSLPLQKTSFAIKALPFELSDVMVDEFEITHAMGVVVSLQNLKDNFDKKIGGFFQKKFQRIGATFSGSEIQLQGQLESEFPSLALDRYMQSLKREQTEFARIRWVINSKKNIIRKQYGWSFYLFLLNRVSLDEKQNMASSAYETNEGKQFYDDQLEASKHLLRCMETRRYNQRVMLESQRPNQMFTLKTLTGKTIIYSAQDAIAFAAEQAEAPLRLVYKQTFLQLVTKTANHFVHQANQIFQGIEYSNERPLTKILSPFTSSRRRLEFIVTQLRRVNPPTAFAIRCLENEIQFSKELDVAYFFSLSPHQRAQVLAYREDLVFSVDSIPNPDADLIGAEGLLEALDEMHVNVNNHNIKYEPPNLESKKKTHFGFGLRQQKPLYIEQIKIVKLLKFATNLSIRRSVNTFQTRKDVIECINCEVNEIYKNLKKIGYPVDKQIVAQLHEFNEPGGILEIVSSNDNPDIKLRKQKENRKQKEEIHKQLTPVEIGNAGLPEPYYLPQKLLTFPSDNPMRGFFENDKDLFEGYYASLPMPLKIQQQTLFASLNKSLPSYMRSRPIRKYYFPKLTKDYLLINTKDLPYLLAEYHIKNYSVGFSFNLDNFIPKHQQVFKNNLKFLLTQRYRIQFHEGNPLMKTRQLNWTQRLQLMQVQKDNISFYLNKTQQNIDSGRLSSVTITPCENEIAMHPAFLGFIIISSILLGVAGSTILQKTRGDKKDTTKNDNKL